MVPLRLQSFHGKKFERNAQMGGERESCFPISYQELHFIKLRNAFTRASISGGDLQSSCISHCFLELCVTVYRKTEAVRVSAAEQEEESTRISWRWSLVHHQFAALPIVYKIRIKSLRFLFLSPPPPLFLPSFLSSRRRRRTIVSAWLFTFLSNSNVTRRHSLVFYARKWKFRGIFSPSFLRASYDVIA